MDNARTHEVSTMTVEQGEILDVIDDEVDTGTSIDDIYTFLLRNEDIILVIDADEEESLRRGLTLVKHRHQKKIKEAGVKQDEVKQIGFRVIEEIANTEPKQVRIQIWLKKRVSVKIHKMLVSDKEI